MINHNVVQPNIQGMMRYFTTYLSYNLLVKEFLKLVNIWRSYRQNGRLFHAPHLHCTFVLRDADLA